MSKPPAGAAMSWLPAPTNLATSFTSAASIGLPTADKGDASPVFGEWLNANPDPKTLVFGPGYHVFGTPPVIETNGVTIQGAGNQLSFIKLDSLVGFIVGQALNPNGSPLNPLRRPDSFGVLDPSACSTPGTVFGYSAGPETYALGLKTSASLGCKGPTSAYDYYGSMPGFTVQVVFTMPSGWPTASCPFMGNGYYWNPSPWCFQFEPDYRIDLFVKLVGDSIDDTSGPPRRFSFTVPPLGVGPYRLAAGVDFVTGVPFARCGGAACPFVSDSTPAAPGKTFLPARGFEEFAVATNRQESYANRADKTDVAVHGLRLSNVARPQDGPNDQTNFFTDDANVFFLIPPQATTGRLIQTKEGKAGNGRFGTLLIFTQTARPQWVSDVTFNDICFWGGSPAVSYLNCLNLNFNRCRFVGSTCGVSAVLGDWSSYVIRLTDCFSAGLDAAYDLRTGTAFLRNCDCGGAGNTYARFQGMNATWQGSLLGFNGPQTGIDIGAGGYGGQYSFEDLTFDNEGNDFPVSVIRADQNPQGGTLNLSRVYADHFGGQGNGSFLNLRSFGSSWTGNWAPSLLHAAMTRTAGRPNAALLQVDGPGWAGEFDARCIPPGSRSKIGSGSANINMVGA